MFYMFYFILFFFSILECTLVALAHMEAET